MITLKLIRTLSLFSAKTVTEPILTNGSHFMILVKIGGEVAWFDAFILSIRIVAPILELFRYREQYVW